MILCLVNRWSIIIIIRVSYQMVYLLNRELSFDVDLSTVGCGINAAFFFVGMNADGGKAKYGYKGPVYGTG